MSTKTLAMIVIADDLTGANDTGVQFARKGLETEIFLEGTVLSPALKASIVVVDTNSRSIPAKDAYTRVREVAEQAHRAGFQHYYKKLDSTLRGNVGVELEAILDLGLHEFALVMPAFPKNGRTTIGGNHLLHGVPLSTTEIAKDPKTPVLETVLPELLRQQTTALVGHIGITELAQGEEAIVATMKRYLAEGCTILSCDAWLDEHFQLVAHAALRVSERILWSGSAALAECLPELFSWTKKSQLQVPSLVIAGSVSAVTRGQVQELLIAGYELVEIKIADYLPWQENASLPCLQEVLSYLKKGKSVVLASGFQSDAVEQTKIAGEKLGLSPFEISEITAQILGYMGADILEQQPVAGVILTGGDTAVAVCRALGVASIRVLEEVAPAIPLGEMETATGKKLRVVTKAGAFGNPDALVKSSEKLQQRRE